MSNNPNYGKVTETNTLDSNGSTVSLETNYQGGHVRLPRYRHYEYRERVKDSKEESAQYFKFLAEKEGKLKTNFHTERTKIGDSEGWYYVVKCWTEAVID